MPKNCEYDLAMKKVNVILGFTCVPFQLRWSIVSCRTLVRPSQICSLLLKKELKLEQVKEGLVP